MRRAQLNDFARRVNGCQYPCRFASDATDATIFLLLFGGKFVQTSCETDLVVI